MRKRASHPMPDKRLRLCAFALMASGLASSCGRDDGNEPPREEPPASLPHFRPSPGPPGRDALIGGKNRNPASKTLATSDGCPVDMARVESFCIDRHEIHLEDSVSGAMHPYFIRPPAEMARLRAVSSAGVFPQGYMSQETASKACANAGKRLCTLDEWQRACRGPNNAQFPYGPAPLEGACNVNKRSPHILDKHFPDVPHMKRTGRHFNDPALLQNPDYLAKTGAFQSCVTPQGVFDMDGNLSEWVADSIMKGQLKHGTFAGDAFSGHGNQGCGRNTGAHSSDYHDYSMGARCCSNPR